MLRIFETYKVYVFAFLVCALLVTALGAYVVISGLSAQLKEAQDTVVALRTANGLLTSANQTMSKDLDTQNAAVRKVQAEQEARSRVAEAALRKLQEDRNRWHDRYAVLIAAPAGKDQCASVLSLVDGYYALRGEEGK